jgi:hypothetical protein
MYLVSFLIVCRTLQPQGPTPLIIFLTLYFYFSTYKNMLPATRRTKLTNIRRLGEKVTNRYHSVDALNIFSLPKEVPWSMPV